MSTEILNHYVEVLIDKVDFHPKKVQSGSTSRYENLVELIKRANFWLHGNPDVRCFKVETVTYPVTDFEHFADEQSSAKRLQFDNQTYIRYLRLWVRSPTQDDDEDFREGPQMLYAVNIIPRKLRRNNTFETMEAAVQRFFHKLKKDPIQGRIISAITDEVTIDDWPNEIEADKLYWIDSKHGETAYATIMRLFVAYDMEVNVEKIGFEDFVPTVLGYNEAMNAPVLENLPTVLGRVREWINDNSNVEVLGIQTVRCRTRGMYIEDKTPVDVTKTLVHGNSEVELFVLYIRLYFHTIYEVPEDGIFEDDDVKTIDLYQRTFIPHIYRGTKKVPVNYFTDQLFTVATMAAWLRANKAKLLTVETSAVIHTSAGLLTDSDVTWFRSSQMGNVIVYVARLYTDGTFVEPMPSMLPTPPMKPSTFKDDERLQKRKSCVLQ